MKPKQPKILTDDDLTSVKLTRKTSKLLMALTTLTDAASTAEYCSRHLDGILEERLAKIVQARTNKEKGRQSEG